MSMQFRKRPLVIEAVRWDGSNENEIQAFIGGYLKRVIGDMLFIGTLEGIMCASVGDYIIKGVKGEFYSCKPDIFAETYEDATIPPESLRPQGEWIKDEHGALYCNICGNGAEERFGEQCETPYCNNCGAVMKNGGEPVDYKSLYPWLRLRCTMNDKDKLAKAAVWLLISLAMLAIAVAAWAQIR